MTSVKVVEQSGMKTIPEKNNVMIATAAVTQSDMKTFTLQLPERQARLLMDILEGYIERRDPDEDPQFRFIEDEWDKLLDIVRPQLPGFGNDSFLDLFQDLLTIT